MNEKCLKGKNEIETTNSDKTEAVFKSLELFQKRQYHQRMIA